MKAAQAQRLQARHALLEQADALLRLAGARLGVAQEPELVSQMRVEVPLASQGGNQGLAVFTAGSPSSYASARDASAPLGEIAETVTAGASGLSYDAGANQYVYVWKTDKAWGATGRVLTVRLRGARPGQT